MNKKLLPQLFFVLAFCLFTQFFYAQYATKHHVAPAPWQYWSTANEIVVSTAFNGMVEVTLSKSDGTFLTTLNVTANIPVSYRFEGNAAALTRNQLNTTYNDRGLIVEATQPVIVNLRNIASDAAGLTANTIKGNASLVSFGDEGLGTQFRLGYYRTSFTGLNNGNPVYSVMATENDTEITLNGVVQYTLQQGQSRLFTALTGALLEASKPVVANVGSYGDTPQACGGNGEDGTFDQVAPVNVLGSKFVVVRGSGQAGTGANHPEQTTIVASVPGTLVTVTHYNAAGTAIGTTTYELLAAGDFQTFHHGDAATQYSSSFIESNNPIVVYAGTAVACETDISTVLPIGGCAGATDVRTRKFINYTDDNLPYFGYIIIESDTTPVYINNLNIETLTGINRQPIGTTGFYMIRFNNTNIGNPVEILINSTARLTTSLVQQGEGFSMSGFFSAFSDSPSQPAAPEEQEGCGKVLTTTEGLAPYQWYLNGEPIPGATESTYTATVSGNYSVQGTRDCGLTSISPPLYVEVIPCTDLAIDKESEQSFEGTFFHITVTNADGQDDTEVEVTDVLPSGYTYVSATATQGTYNPSTGIWTIGNLAAGASVTLTIEVTINETGIFLNSATVTGHNIDLNNSNNTDTAKTESIRGLAPLPDLSICNDQPNSFDLTVYDDVVYYGNIGYEVTYYNSLADADAYENAITEPLLSNYTATSGETIWVRVSKITNPSIYNTTSFRLWVNALPSVNPDAGPMYGCEIPGTGTGDFTLSLNDGNLTLNQPGLTVTYYQTQQQAEVGDATVALPNNYQGPQGTIYARVTNNNTGCYVVVAQELVVRSTPVANNHAPLIFCDADNDGFGIFNLESISHEIAGNPIPAGIEVSYHESLSDAQNNVEAISTPSAFVNTQANGQTLYVRVGYEHSSCASIVPLELIVSKTPAIKRPTPLMVCDADNNGIAIFDLTVKNTEILNGLPAADYTFTYHTTAANAQQGTNAIANPTSYSNQTTGTVYVRVTNTATGCFSVVPLSLVAGATPVVAHPIAEYAQCDDNQDGFATFNLNSRIPSILNGQTGMAVTFHYTAADAQSGAAALPLSYQNVVANIQTLHVRVTNQVTGCYTVSTMNLRVIAGPVITVPDTPYAICSSGQSGFGTVDLTYYGNQLVLGTGYQISYFETETNAIANTSPIGLPTAYNNLVGSNPVIWLRITNPVTGCFSVYSISFVLEIAPLMPDTLPDLTECDVLGDLYDGFTTFDLTEQDAAILAAQTGTGPYVIRYYTTAAAAAAGQPWIADPVNFVNTQANQTIWVRIENSSNQNKCNAIGSFKLKVNTPLQLGAAPDLVQCNESLPNDESTVFDLTVNESLITQGQVFGATVTYHTSLVNAEAGLNDIPDPTAFTNTSNPQVIWVAVTNEFGCKAYKTFNVRVLPLPEPNLTPSPLQVCEEAPGSGEGFFVLTDAISDISNGDPTLTYEFYTTEEDALTGLSDLALDSTVPHLSVTSVIYVRVMNQFAAENMSCAVIVPLELIVNPTPLAGPMTPLLHCEQGSDGIHKFNLHDKDAEALAGQPSADYTVRYFLTEEDAQNNTNPIPYTYTNNGSPFDQEIWVRVENNDSECFAITTFHLKVEEQVFAFPATDNLSFCDIDGVNDGLTVVDLTLLNAQIIGIQDAGPLDVRYYASAANYSLGIVIGDPTQYQTESNPQTLIAEVYNTGEGMLCKATIEVTINVIDAPEMNDIKDGYICEDYRTGERQGYPMDTGLPAEGHTFSWTRNGDDIGVSTPSYTATEPGTYVVTVTNTATGCSASQTIVLTLAPALSIDVVYTTDGFSDTNAIEVVVSPAGDYEYALDEGPYQQSNIFMNVSPGDHTVWVRVRNSAGSVACPASKVITVLNYPKYFTPNGDGYNDTWNIWALKSQPASKIYIFDRHGKLLKQISPAGSGWDGTLNGNPLPSTDYWFRVEYVEPNTGLQKEARGHFSLKR